MRKQHEAIVEIVDAERKCHSIYGNPSWWVTVIDAQGKEFKGYTASNASCGYIAGDLIGVSEVLVKYHYTAKGNLVVDFMYTKGEY